MKAELFYIFLCNYIYYLCNYKVARFDEDDEDNNNKASP